MISIIVLAPGLSTPNANGSVLGFSLAMSRVRLGRARGAGHRLGAHASFCCRFGFALSRLHGCTSKPDSGNKKKRGGCRLSVCQLSAVSCQSSVYQSARGLESGVRSQSLSYQSQVAQARRPRARAGVRRPASGVRRPVSGVRRPASGVLPFCLPPWFLVLRTARCSLSAIRARVFVVWRAGWLAGFCFCFFSAAVGRDRSCCMFLFSPPGAGGWWMVGRW